MRKIDEILGDISINQKIKSIAIAAGLLALTFSTVITIVGLNNNMRYRKSMDNFFRQFSLMRDISENYNKIRAMTTEYLLFWGDKPITDGLSEQFDACFVILEADIVELEGMLPPLSPQNEAINKVYGYLYHLQNFRFTLPSLQPEETESFFIKLQKEIIGPLDNNITVAFNAMVKNIDQESKINQKRYSESVTSSYIAIAVFFILGIVYVSMIVRNIRVPLSQLINSTEYFGRGDYGVFNSVNRKDELGILNNKFVSAAQEIKKVQTELAIYAKSLQELNTTLEMLSTTDQITGISNRRALDEFLGRAWDECKRLHIPITIMYMDIDRFKYFNDTYGHLKGDECLRSFVRCVRRYIKRTVDIFARYGGEEFVAVLPTTPGEAALALAEEIRCAVQDMKIPNPKSEAGPYVTVSIGLAARYPYQIDSAQALMELADQMCYNSKSTGRNRITLDAGPPYDAESESLSLANIRTSAQAGSGSR
ncbi:MAG: diguanylate cyclase [Candidatus Adiutrix sp.]|jgi:diguanylate cyclase (GGDEF)-like protein|nr:diguanylate cyclase [Candidatus Adiutrix sp.]